jgi:hypothetical protein
MKIIMSLLIFCFSFVVLLSAQSLITDQFQKGEIVLRDPGIGDGKFRFIANTGGCTSKSSFKVIVDKDKSKNVIPHYRLTVERQNPDYCKGLFPEGVIIEFDLEKDLGLKGNYTISIVNRIYVRNKK